jgi:hypothetical protein
MSKYATKKIHIITKLFLLFSLDIFVYYLSPQLDKVPCFFREIEPKPGKHTVWTLSHDFTQGQASKYRYVIFFECFFSRSLSFIHIHLNCIILLLMPNVCILRRHYIQFPPGVLDQYYAKLLQCDNRLLELSQRPFPSSHAIYFDSHLDRRTTQLNFCHDSENPSVADQQVHDTLPLIANYNNSTSGNNNFH